MYKPDPNNIDIECKDLYSKEQLEHIKSITETFVSEKSLQKGQIIEMAIRTVRLPNGKEATREVAYHSGAAAVVAVDDELNTYLVYQHRCVLSKISLEIPAGKMDPNENDPKTCAIRELAEETGIEANNMDLLLKMDSTPGFCTEYVAIYLASDLKHKKSHTDEDEFLGLIKIPLKEAVKRVKSGEICDAKTAIGLLLAADRYGVIWWE